MTKRILLTMADELYNAIAQKTKQNGYLTIQELINDILRKNLFDNATRQKSKAGRPAKKTFEDYFSTPTKATKQLQKEGLI